MNLPCECDNGSPCPVHTDPEDWVCASCGEPHHEDDDCPESEPEE